MALDTGSATATPTQLKVPATRPGRWLDHYDPEDEEQWAAGGRGIAYRNLRWSIFTEFLGFVVWGLWSIVVVSLPRAGFTFTTSEVFWLISVPSLVGATMRFPYTFAVAKFGGRNWTIVSGLLLLIPSIGLAVAVSNPATPFWQMLLIAATAGLGGGNFASSMANITYFFPRAEKGWALGLNAAGGNLGASMGQLVVPIVITLGAASMINLPVAGLVWIPLIIVAVIGAWRRMDNLSGARSDFAASLAVLRQPHLWVISFLYIGTFGSFIGFAGVFPKLISDAFPAYSGFQVGAATVSLAFLGALVGSLARPLGGRLSDRLGGARLTAVSFAALALGVLGAIFAIKSGSFWIFLACFCFLFIATGVGNGSTYRMLPAVFHSSEGVTGARLAAASLGIVSAIGAYGGFVIPQVLRISYEQTGGYDLAFGCFAGAYLIMLVVTWACYLRRGSAMAGQRI